MGLRDLDLKGCYESSVDDLLNDFYIKVLENATEYSRISGFFSSTCLAVSAKGIRGLVDNNGTMRLIISPRLSIEDINMIDNAILSPEKVLESNLVNEIENIEDLIQQDYLAAFGWLLAKEILEIKIATVHDNSGKVLDYEKASETGLFHIKVGIIKDSNNDIISFSGSINETASGWMKNIEEFKVFKMWHAEQSDYCKSDVEKFESYWDQKRDNVKIYDLPEAVKQCLFQKAPKSIEDIQCLREIKKRDKEMVDFEIPLFDYQKTAIKMWQDNNKKLICEMATATGKTRVAIGCISLVLKENGPKVFFVVCPQNTLSLQWKKEIEDLSIPIDDFMLADGTVRNWREKLESKLLDLTLGMINSCIIYTSFNTFSSVDFMNIVRNNKNKSRYMIIGDEAHGLGATKISKGLLEIYDYRIGLSATPERWFDELGTKKIKDFFGSKSFEFTIKDALNTINPLTNKPYLTEYVYKPIFVSLNDDEIESYNNLTQKIVKQFNIAKNNDDAYSKLENLMFMRASIHKSAVNKYEAFEKLLDDLNNDIKDTLIFVSDIQMQKIIDIVSKRRVRAHKYTQEEGTIILKKYGGRTERQYIIENFKLGKYQSLLAIKCLDEGIDIPSAQMAIILASSSNPREYIQRIGRVIRRYPGKDQSVIYDFIVKPSYSNMDPDLKVMEKRIYKKELVRVFEIAQNAINTVEVTKLIFDMNRGDNLWE